MKDAIVITAATLIGFVVIVTVSAVTNVKSQEKAMHEFCVMNSKLPALEVCEGAAKVANQDPGKCYKSTKQELEWFKDACIKN